MKNVIHCSEKPEIFCLCSFRNPSMQPTLVTYGVERSRSHQFEWNTSDSEFKVSFMECFTNLIYDNVTKTEISYSAFMFAANKIIQLKSPAILFP